MQINRLVFPGFWFGKTTEQQGVELACAGAGGFCVYGGGDKETLAVLCRKLRASSPWGEDLIIAADYEDGLGRWLPDTDLLPSNMALGAADDENLAFEKGYITAREALAIGVNWVYAPVLDLADNPKNPIVNTRSFGKNPKRVTRLARAFMRGLAEGGVLNSIKHFPGHGNTQTDSHLALPVVSDDLQTLRANALKPFGDLLAAADSVMVGHLSVPCLDEKYPASLSEKIMRGLLCGELNYQKCICTDALCMKALGDEKESALRAFNSGAHILLAPEDAAGLMSFLHEQHLDQARVKAAVRAQEDLVARGKFLREKAAVRPYDAVDFGVRAARQSLVRVGDFTPLQSGQCVSVLEVGNDEKIKSDVFFKTLEKNGIVCKPFEKEADTLLVLFWRRYQAFKGKIGLSPEESTCISQAAAHAKRVQVVCFSSPWLARETGIENCLCTFSPAPAFQEAAALALCGKMNCAGKLPVDL